MPIRIYVAQQRGSGSDLDPYTNVLNDLIDVSAGDKFQEIDNTARKVSICVVTASNATHSAIIADGRAVPVTPSVATDDASFRAILNSPFDSYPTEWKTAAKTKLEQWGVNTGWITGSNSIKDVIRYIIRHYFMAQSATDSSAMTQLLSVGLDTTAGDLTPQQRSDAREWMQDRGLAVGWITNSTTIREVVHFIGQNMGYGTFTFGGESF